MSATIVTGEYASEVIKRRPNDVWKYMRDSGLLDRAKAQGAHVYVRGSASLSEMSEAERLHEILTGKIVEMGLNEVLCVFVRRVETPNPELRPLTVLAGELAKHFHPEEEKVDVRAEV